MSADLAEGLVCPHCGERLVSWEPPPDCSWTSVQFVCVNDDCSYYVKGWKWMEERYGVHASYRYRIDPSTGQGGALPVNSATALKDAVAPSGEEDS